MSMRCVWLFIDKFGREVFINDDHPLAIAQRAQETESTSPSAVQGADDPPPTVADPVADAAPSARPSTPSPRGRRRRA